MPPKSRPPVLAGLLAVVGGLFALAASPAGAVDPLSPTGAPVPPIVAQTIARVEAKARYLHSTWGLLVADANTGQVLVSQNPEKLFTPGSTLKTYSAAAVLHDYGAGHRFRTPVFRSGSIRRGVLSGNLVLVASGDFSFGLRDRPNGTQAYNSAPQLDHSDADGAPGPTLVPHSNPLAGVEHVEAIESVVGVRVDLHFVGSLARPVQSFDLVRLAHRHHGVAIAVQDKQRRQLAHLLGKVVGHASEEVDDRFHARLL